VKRVKSTSRILYGVVPINRCSYFDPIEFELLGYLLDGIFKVVLNPGFSFDQLVLFILGALKKRKVTSPVPQIAGSQSQIGIMSPLMLEVASLACN